MFKQITGHELQFFGGLLVALFLEPVVKWLRDEASKDKASMDGKKTPLGVEQSEWEEIVRGPEAGGKWLGRIERTIFFVALWVGEPILIGGWLVFKATTKWEVWTNIVKVPDKLELAKDDVDFLRARHKWGARVLQRFLVGTAANILAGLVGVFVGRTVI